MEMKGKWINPEIESFNIEERQPASCLKKAFEAAGGKKYTLLATARGTYAFFVNGVRYDAEVLSPGQQQEPVLYFYQTMDITDLIHDGTNEIMFILTDGFHRGQVTNSAETNVYGTDLALLACMYEDDSLLFETDESWQASQSGPVRFSDMTEGEVYDARLEEITDWHGVLVSDFKAGMLKHQYSSSIKEHERLKGTEFMTPEGDRIIDFGQNLAGYVEIDTIGREGEELQLDLFESLDGNGNFQNANFQNRKGTALQYEKVILKDGRNFYKPFGGYYGFRYARVSGNSQVKAEDLTAIAVYNDMKFCSDFSCDNALINSLYKNTLWSFKSNFVSVPTDCPTREKAGYTGDYEVFLPTAMYLSDVYEDSREFLEKLAVSQREDGLIYKQVPCLKPEFGGRLEGASGWSDAIAIIPDLLSERYGNEEILKEFYPSIKKWADFELKRAAESTKEKNADNPWKEYLLDSGFQWGEWMEPGSNSMLDLKKYNEEGVPDVTGPYLANTCRIAGKAAEILGIHEEAEYYKKASENCVKAWRYLYVKDGKLQYDENRMCTIVRPLYFGNLLTEEESRTAAEALNEMLVRNDYAQNTGFLTTHALLRVLADYGYVDTAWKVLLHESMPGWMYEIQKGATTIWENWNGIDEEGNVHDSLNHYSYGAAVSFLFDTAAGIRIKGDSLTIAPHPYEPVGSLNASYDSPLGKVKVSWHYEGGKPVYETEVPVKAKLILPDGTERILEPGISKSE